MGHVPYDYDPLDTYRYKFVSMGRKRIEKVVEFIPTGIPKIMNLSFGDVLIDGSIDHTSISNNGDVTKVMATVIEIIDYFTSKRPEVAIIFTGSTTERIRLYKRILRLYYPVFRKTFLIWGIVRMGDDFEDVPFHPDAAIEYSAFLIKRIV